MEFFRIVAYHGPNRWAAVPTLEVLVDFQARAAWRSNSDPQSISRLMSWLPALDDPPQTTSIATDQSSASVSFSKLAARGISLGLVFERLVCLFESAAGTPPNYSATEFDTSTSATRLTIQFEEESLARACLETARTCLLAALIDQSFEAAAEIRKLVDLADDVRLGPSTRAILRAAAARGVPCRRLTNGSLVQLGEGARQHRIWTAETDRTSSIGEDIAQDKELTKLLLRSVGVPVPQGRVAATIEQARAAAQDIGYPVVIKPRDANHGRGVSFDLTTAEQVSEAFDLALRENKDGTTGVIVEQFARGQAHRLLVVSDRLVAATRGQNDVVIGNGRDSIAKLIDEANRNPLRGTNYTDLLTPMELDDVTLLELKQQGLTPESILASGHEVIVRHNGDLTTDETSDVHPAVAERAVLAAQTVGLNIAGIDVIAADIGRPLEEQGGMIIEVNAGPSLSMHVEPLYGEPQPVGDAIVELMFPGGDDGRIPIIALDSHPAAANIGRLIAGLLRKLGRRVGMAIGDEVQVDGQRTYVRRGSDHDRIHALLLHPRVEAAIFESRTEQALANGLGCERCDVSVLGGLNVTNGHPSNDDVVRRTLPLVHAVPPEGAVIVPATAPRIETLLSACRGQVLLYSSEGEVSRLREHQAQGGRVAFCLHDNLVLGAGPNAYFLPLKRLESTGLIARDHLLPAVAAAWCAGVPVEALRDIVV